jgi:glycosyltransferase involved in cell wall biosynthesis
MACGKAVIVSEISEFRYLITNKVGLSFKTGDALSLAQSMKDMMTNDEWKEMGKRGRNLVKNFTWDKIALKYEGFLQDIVSGVK